MKIKDVIGLILSLCLMTVWIFGIVLAKGFWLTVLAITVVPYDFYLVIEHFFN